MLKFEKDFRKILKTCFERLKLFLTKVYHKYEKIDKKIQILEYEIYVIL